MTQPTAVTLTLDLDAHLSTWSRSSGPFGEEVIDAHPISLEEVVITAAAREVASRLSGEALAVVRQRAEAVVDEVLTAKVGEAITAWLEAPLQRTDTFGNPKGEPTTFAAYVEGRVTEALTTRTRDRDRDNLTVVDRTIRDQVKTEVPRQVKAAVAEQRDAILQQVTASTAEVLTEGMRRATVAAGT